MCVCVACVRECVRARALVRMIYTYIYTYIYIYIYTIHILHACSMLHTYIYMTRRLAVQASTDGKVSCELVGHSYQSRDASLWDQQSGGPCRPSEKSSVVPLSSKSPRTLTLVF
jgi:hypothetical protein